MTTKLEATQKFQSEIVAFVRANPTTTLIEIGKLFGVSSAYISVVSRAAGITRRYGRGSTAWKFKAKLDLAAPAVKEGV